MIPSVSAPDPDEVALRRQVPLALLRLAGPVIATMISRTVMNFVDFVMVSQLGAEAQAAIVPAQVALMVLTGIGMGLAPAVTTLVSQSLGRQRLSDCSAYGWHGLYLSGLLGLAVLPFWFAVPPIFAWAGHEPQVQSMEVAYAKIGIVSIGPTVAAMVLAGFFNGIHRPTVGLIAGMVSNVFNIAANYALIFGHWGFSPMGIAGAAWATLAALLLQAIILLAWMLWPSINRTYQVSRTWRPSARFMRGAVRLAIPIGVYISIDILCWTVFIMVLVGRFGTVHLAASSLCFKLLEVSFNPTLGLGMALTSAVGKAIGQGRKDLVRLNARWAMVMAATYMGVVGALYLLIPDQLAGLLTNEDQVRDIAAKVLIFCALFQVFDASAIVFSSALRGAGDTHWTAAISIIYVVVILVGGGILLVYFAPHWKSYGPWVAATVFIAVLATTLWARFVFGPWERIELVGDDARS